MSYLTLISKVSRTSLTNNLRTANRLNNCVLNSNNCIRKYSFCGRRMNPSALLLLADGAEDLEAVTVADILRRGNVNVTIGGVCGPDPVKCSNGTIICPDMALVQAMKKSYDAIVMPGGLGGSKILCETCIVGQILQDQDCHNRIIAAICAAPTALKAHNIGKGRAITSYPAMADELKKGDIYIYKDDCPVVVDEHFITSRGPATAMIFALTILEQLQGREKANEVAKALLYKY